MIEKLRRRAWGMVTTRECSRCLQAPRGSLQRDATPPVVHIVPAPSAAVVSASLRAAPYAVARDRRPRRRPPPSGRHRREGVARDRGDARGRRCADPVLGVRVGGRAGSVALAARSPCRGRGEDRARLRNRQRSGRHRRRTARRRRRSRRHRPVRRSRRRPQRARQPGANQLCEARPARGAAARGRCPARRRHLVRGSAGGARPAVVAHRVRGGCPRSGRGSRAQVPPIARRVRIRRVGALPGQDDDDARGPRGGRRPCLRGVVTAPSALGAGAFLWYHPPSRPALFRCLRRPSPPTRNDPPERFPLAKTPRTWSGARSPSGLKRVRQAARRREVLAPRRSAAKTYVATALATAATADSEATTMALIDALSALDRAAKVGAIHPNAAARRKSRLTIKVNAALGGSTVSTGGRVTKQTGKAAQAKAAKARIAASKSAKAKGAQTAAGKARAALSKTARAEAAAAQAAAEASAASTEAAPTRTPAKPTATGTTKTAPKKATTTKAAAKPAPKATAKAAPKPTKKAATKE